jgi:hypothetical protein
MASDQTPILLVEEEDDVMEPLTVGRPTNSKLRTSLALGVVLLVAATLAVVSGLTDKLRFRNTINAHTAYAEIARKDSTAKECTNVWGAQVAEPDSKQEAFKPCSAKWTEDCGETGCCSDWGMKCFRKNPGWAACKKDCQKKDEKNESWTCAVVTPPTPRTAEECFAKCKGKPSCKQAVFSGDGGASCRLSDERMTKVAWASDSVNSTLCGTALEQAEVKDAVAKIQQQLPFQVDMPLVNCSWGGEDCSASRCCNDYLCDKNFANCNGFSCYKKDKYFAGCAAAPLKGWDGKWMGGPREHRVIPPAASQVAVQGTSLYCFTVVTWDAPRPKPFWNSEAELANNWKSQGLHVLQCDGHEVLDGVVTPKAEWGSFSNIDMFMQIWYKVKQIGNWKNYDWTVKVDSDAVFLPQRLKDHLYNLRTPRGARVYLENINFKFKFMGAIEIMTREALSAFLELGHTCIRGKHEGGEDSFLKTCLDGLGIDHQSDWQILHDKYAGLNPPCTDGWAVAYHYLKKTHDWSQCYNNLMCGSKDGKGCDKAISVPHEPGYVA